MQGHGKSRAREFVFAPNGRARGYAIGPGVRSQGSTTPSFLGSGLLRSANDRSLVRDIATPGRSLWD